jgi:2-phosphoglycerate kinase
VSIRTRVLLIGGSSHTGKSTVAARLASELGWRHLSTDQLARHPGRPWKDDPATLPADVVEHFSSHTPEQLLEIVLAHYRENVWPIAEAVVRSHLNNSFDPSLVLEGSAILPELVHGAQLPPSCAAAWFTASPEVIQRRILDGSRFEARRPHEGRLIETFLERSVLFNTFIGRTAADLGCRCLESGSADSLGFLREIVTPRGEAGGEGDACER